MTAQMTREFNARTITRDTEVGEDDFVEYVDHEALERFRVRYPKVGRCYRLDWTDRRI
jgi:hypothetical protein